ncbi:ABC transporter permease [Methylomonas sp. OY6]|uniref:ABC transporter permease n=1 Tax=Methylomonas defluvii TaxID=3045149 RepID=A0ABU4UBS0_9GAMM|nr:ABC transporter permease [Methylomonas sp. OY6]MDX8126901.1 ABC transporter permease [Methylomonas sp. OY6]
MFERTRAILLKETRELLRDPVYLGLAFIVPIALMLLFGYGMSADVTHMPILFVDHDRSFFSRDYMDGYTHSDYFDLVGVTNDTGEVEHWLRSGKARVIVDIPPDFSRKITGGEPVSLGVTVDGSFAERAEVMVGYVSAINGLYNQRLFERAMSRSGLPPPQPVQMAVSVWYNPALESKNFIVPGMMVIILMLYPAILGALLVVREKEAGTIFNYYASPARRWEIIAGKALPYVGVIFLDYLILFAMSIVLFGVRFIGSFWLLSAGALLYSACTIGIGLLVSVLTRTQIAAMLVTFLATVTPSFNYSGFMAPVASQDRIGQFVAYLLPATHFMDMVRGAYLKGLGFAFYWPNLLALTVYSVLLYGLAWMFLNKRIG